MENSFDFKFPNISRFLKSDFKGSFCLSGLCAPLKLILIDFILKKGLKVLFITSDEQSALKYQKDFENLFDHEAQIFPYQEISPYTALNKNYYIYKEQYEILNNKPDFVIAPVKACLEKFPKESFYKNEVISLEKNKGYDFNLLIQKLVDLGYTRSTMALDIGEFASRGDIIDIYGMYDAPFRIEFFGDTIEDIRFFNPNTQKSFKKVSSVEIQPLFKFKLNEKIKEDFKNELSKTTLNFSKDETLKLLLNETIEKIETTDYFEGIEYYLPYINKNLSSIFDYFSDYILILDESSFINSKSKLLDEEYNEEYKNNLEGFINLPLCNKSHLTKDEFKNETKKFKKIGFDNFIEDEFFENENNFFR